VVLLSHRKGDESVSKGKKTCVVFLLLECVSCSNYEAVIICILQEQLSCIYLEADMVLLKEVALPMHTI